MHVKHGHKSMPQVNLSFLRLDLGEVLLLLAFLIAIGIFLFVTYPQLVHERNSIEALPELNFIQFHHHDIDKRLLVYGQLKGNVTDYDSKLIAWTKYVWHVSKGFDHDLNTSWLIDSSYWPELTLELQGSYPITLIQNSVPEITGSGNHTLIIATGDGIVAYDSSLGKQLSSGTIKLVGAKNGDFVTVIGKKNNNGQIIVDLLYFGSKQQLLKELQIGGFIGLLIAALVVIIVIWVAVQHYTSQRKAEISTTK